MSERAGKTGRGVLRILHRASLEAGMLDRLESEHGIERVKATLRGGHEELPKLNEYLCPVGASVDVLMGRFCLGGSREEF